MEQELIGRLTEFLSKIILDNTEHFLIGRVYKHYIDTNPNFASDKGVVYFMLEKVLRQTIKDSIKEYMNFHDFCSGEYDVVKASYARRILCKFYDYDDNRVLKSIEKKYNLTHW